MSANLSKKNEINKKKNEIFEKKLRWAHVKYFSYSLAKKLYEECQNSELSQQYKNTMFCKWFIELQPYALADNGNVVAHTRSKYCKNRICPICNRIRTSVLYSSYKKPLLQLKNPHFVTLTAPNVSAENLKSEIDLYFENFRKILKANTQNKNRFVGIRKFECTINEQENTFHPHFHVIIDGQYNAFKLMEDWLKLNPNAKSDAQDIKKITPKKFENALLELFKYFTKFFSKKYKKDKKGHYVLDRYGARIPILDKDGKSQICLPNLKKLDLMLCAMKRRRIFQPFGGIKKVNEELIDEQMKSGDLEVNASDYELDELYQLGYAPKVYDWVNPNTGECLSGYTPSERDKKVFE